MACSCMFNISSSDGCLGSNNDEGCAAKCDKHCELQDSVNQQKVERILLLRVVPENMFTSMSFVFSAGRVPQVSRFRVFMFQCSIRCINTCVLVVLGRAQH